jgi:hypothetical protein
MSLRYATRAEENGSMRWIGISLLSLFRGAGWGCLTSFVGSTVFSVFLLVSRGLNALSYVSNNAAGFEYLGYLALAFLYIASLAVMPATVFGTVGGMALGLLVHLDESIGSSTLASLSAGGIVGLALTSLLVGTFLVRLGFGMDYLPLGLYAIVIGTIAGSITGWRLSAK